MWVPTQTKPPNPVSRQTSDDTGVLKGALKVDNGWTQTMSEQQILDCDTSGPGCQRGLPKQARDWKRGMSPRWNANVVSGATTMFPGIGERTTKELTLLAPLVSAVLSATWWMRLVLSCTSWCGPRKASLGHLAQPPARLRLDTPGHRGRRTYPLPGSCPSSWIV